jgi:hypothetical protein
VVVTINPFLFQKKYLMKILWIQAFVLLLCLLCAGLALAQSGRNRYKAAENDGIKNRYTDGRQAFLGERLQQPFPLHGLLTTIDHEVYDFDQTGRYRIIMCGIANSTGCDLELPYFLALSNDQQYANIDFLYISYDDSATIMKGFAGLYRGRLSHLKIFSVSRDYFLYTDKPMLAYGFPATHFVDDKGRVKMIVLGGRKKATPEETDRFLKADWTQRVNSLLHH